MWFDPHLSPPLSHVLLIWVCVCGSHHSVDSSIPRSVLWLASQSPELLLSGYYWISMSEVGRASIKSKNALATSLRKLALKKCCPNIVISPVGMCYTLELIPRVSKNEAFFLPWGIAYVYVAKCTATWLVLVQGYCGRSGLLGKLWNPKSPDLACGVQS